MMTQTEETEAIERAIAVIMCPIRQRIKSIELMIHDLEFLKRMNPLFLTDKIDFHISELKKELPGLIQK